MKITILMLAYGGLVLFTACDRVFEVIDYGHDACAHCRMTIVDDRFATEMVDEKGKVFKFDDIQCMKQFISSNKKKGDNLFFVMDYMKKLNQPLDATKAVYLKHPYFASPMNGNYAAFENEQEAKRLSDSLLIDTNILEWADLK